MNSMPVNLLDLSPGEFKKFLDSFDHVFSDCDGVVWTTKALPRVGEFFNLMKKHGKTVHFVSNNSVRSRQNYEDKFKEAKIENGYQSLTTPPFAIAGYLKALNFKKKVYAVACDVTVKILKSHGIKTKTGPVLGADIFDDYVQYLEDDPEIGAVVCDCDFKANLAKIHKAVTYLRRPEVLFLCGATDRRIHFGQGRSALGCAIFTNVVSEDSNRSPIVLSKPSKLFGEFAMKRAGVTDPSRVLFIGDMIEQDIKLGKNTGFKTLMLLTNIPKETMLAHKTTRPDFYADSLASIVPLL
ncbi:unnamed protein product [Arctia plantaginis]|uniref:Phosphoglycolate phosphatase n=1 Tax=Arctia plantaginis TaxID=874455 RepID=A0A8S1AZV3_ARCPL|nr:unnamed protein product [Arctia plantaginis]